MLGLFFILCLLSECIKSVFKSIENTSINYRCNHEYDVIKNNVKVTYFYLTSDNKHRQKIIYIDIDNVLNIDNDIIVACEIVKNKINKNDITFIKATAILKTGSSKNVVVDVYTHYFM